MKINKDKPFPPTPFQDFPIIGVGVSAGGLSDFKRFLNAIPKDSGMAYIVVQQTEANNQSILPENFKSIINISVNELKDEFRLTPNHVYIIPYNKTLTASDGILKIKDREKTSPYLTIDVFFKSLAQVHLNLAMGVVLSGTDKDGTLGLESIKEHGGITFAQDEASSSFDGMPQNEINTQVFDFILPPEKIPEKIMQIVNEEVDTECNQNLISKENEIFYKKIIYILYQNSGVDFTNYKQTTIRRRIALRLALSKKEKLEDYVTFLQLDKDEQDKLYNDMLIQVTSFFRDTEIFQIIKEKVFPKILKNSEPSDPIRIWLVGCSNGAEAYSFAITLYESLGEKLSGRLIEIFASDISESAIAKARTGVYFKSELKNVTDLILKKYFVKVNESYKVSQEIRKTCIFTHHNFLKDPPFKKMSIISCRNVLIYMDTYLQKKALTTFHYALKDNGFLILGKSETTSIVPELFAPLSKTEKIYLRKLASSNFVPLAELKKDESLEITANNEKSDSKQSKQTNFRKIAEESLLLEDTPACVVINDLMDIVHIHGNVEPFLVPSPGKPSYNLIKMAKQNLAFELRNVLDKVKTTNSTVIKKGIFFKINNRSYLVTLKIKPLTNTFEPHYLVVFRKTITSINGKKNSNLILQNSESFEDYRISLEKELAQTRHDILALTEGQEVANEELQSANEELLSGSEELQSLNEELITSKEETLSRNEELVNLNQELIGRQSQLLELNNSLTDFKNAIHNSSITSRADKTGIITSVNENFVTISGYNANELIGKTHHIINSNHHPKSFWIEMWKTISKGKNWRAEVKNKAKDGSYYWVDTFIMPFLDDDGEVREYLSIRNDITERKNAEKKLRISEERLEFAIEANNEGVWDFDINSNTIQLTNRCKEMLGYTAKEIGDDMDEWTKLIHPEDLALLIQARNSIFKGDAKSFSNEHRKLCKDGGWKWVQVRGMIAMRNDAGNTVRTIGTYTDISERKLNELELKQSQIELKAILDSSTDSNIFISPDYKIISFNKVANILSKISLNKNLEKGLSILNYIEEHEIEKFKINFNKTLNDEPIYLEKHIKLSDKFEIWLDVNYFPVKNSANEIIGVSFNTSDITKRKVEEQKVEKLNQLLESTNSIAKIGSWDFNLITKELEWTLEHYKIFEIEPYLPPDELYQAYLSKIHPHDIELLDENIEKAIENGSDFRYEHRLLLNGSKVKYVLGIGKLIKNEQGTNIRIKGTCQDITEQKLVEIERDKLYEQMQSISENIPGFTYQFLRDKNANSNFTYISSQAKDILGAEPTEILKDASNAFMLVHSEDLDGLLISIENSYQTLNVWENEFRILINNEIRWIKANSTPVKNKDESVLWSGYMHDITEEKEMQKEINRLSLVAKGTSNAVIITDKNQHIQWVNEGFTAITGYDFNEVIGTDPGKLLQFEGTDETTKQFIRERLNQRLSVKCEILNKAKDGRIYWIDLDIQPLYENNNFVGFFAIQVDITGQKLLEENLRKSNDLLNETNKLASIGTWEYNVSNNKTKWDTITKKIHDVADDYEPRIEDALNFYLDEKSKKTLIESNEKLISTRKRYDLELRIKTQKGNLKWVRIIGDAKYEGEKCTKIYGVMQDIDSRKKFTEALQAKETAEKSNNIKSEFLANMSHEIRTPMNAILGFAELLNGKTNEPKHEKFINGILLASNHLMRLMNDILDLSKIESNKLDVFLAKTNIIEILNELNHVFEYKLIDNKTKLFIKSLTEIPKYLFLDEIRIKQVLFNLIGNAIKFTEKGTITVNVSYKKETLNFEIKDTGIGIPKEKLESIFAPFNQIENDISRKYGGTGLGLSISKNLTNLMGGEIFIESELGKGSSFKVIIDNVKEADGQEIKINKIKKINYNFIGAEILLVEDNFSNREIVKGYLENSNVTIIEAENGAIALNLLKKIKPKLILLDIMMPIKDGNETALEIRKNESLKNIPIIALTALSKEDLKNKKLFNSYLRKPISKDELLTKIGEFLSYEAISLFNNDENILNEIILTDKVTFKNKFRKKYIAIEKHMVNDDILLFANDLLDYAIVKNELELEIYAKKLINTIHDFEIDEMITLVKTIKPYLS